MCNCPAWDMREGTGARVEGVDVREWRGNVWMVVCLMGSTRRKRFELSHWVRGGIGRWVSD